LYRDDEFKTTIQALRHKAVQEAVAKLPVPDFGSAANVVSSKNDDWNFKEGNTAVVTLGGKKAQPAKDQKNAVKISGAKRAMKAVSKMSGSAKADMKAKLPKSTSTVEKVMKFTPKKSVNKGKQSTSGKKPAASPGGKKSAVGTTDHMNMQTLKKFIKYQKDNGKKASVLKKQATGKKSTGK